MKKVLIAGAAVGVAAAGYFAMSGGDSKTTGNSKTTMAMPKSDGILKRGNGAEPATLDPHFATGVWENNILGDLFMGLTTEATDGKIVAGLAKDWKVSRAGKRYTFTLRDAVWSDGKKITAQDFEYSLKRILDPKTAAKYAFILYPIKGAESINKGKSEVNTLGVKALNETTLQIDLENATPFFLEQLAHYTAWAVPKHVVEKHGKDWTKKQNIVSSGAFVLKNWTPQTSVQLVKNDKFWDAKNVSLKGVNFYPIEDANSELKRFKAGDIHTTSSVPSGQFASLKEDFNDTFHVAPYLGVYYYPVNASSEKLKNVDVRKALSMSINREVIAEKILGEGQAPAYTFVPPKLNNFVSQDKQHKLDFANTSYDENVATAKSLMEKAGYTSENPLTIQLKYNTSEAHKKVAVAVAAMWKKIGVKTELFNQEAKVHYANLKDKDFEVGRAGWIGDYNDPTTFTDLFLDNAYNYSGLKNPKVIKLAKEAAKTLDLEKRGLILANLEKLALEDHSTIPIYYYVSKHLVSSSVNNWKDNVMDIHRSRWLSTK